MISEKFGFFDTLASAKFVMQKKKTLIHSEKRPKKLHKKNTKKCDTKKCPKKSSKPRKKIPKKLKNTSR